MSDWLSFHELDRVRCRAILGRAADAIASEPIDGNSVRTVSPILPFTAEQAWTLATGAMGRRCSALMPITALAHHTVRTDFKPDVTRFPRAFTLHDDGAGRPYVSCPYHGRAADLMAVAHEFGHALQIIATGQAAPFAPVLREVCAFLGELSLLSDLQQGNSEFFPVVLAVWRSDSREQFSSDLTKLRVALLANDPPYSYQWNYPVARILAIEADRHLTSEETLRLFRGQLPIPHLCDLVGL